MSQPLSAIQEYIDWRLAVHRQGDATGNGLLVSGRPLVVRIGAALNTSHAATAAADASAVDLLLVHHAPWAEIDLHLRAGKIARLRELGISLYAAHESLDEWLQAVAAALQAPVRAWPNNPIFQRVAIVPAVAGVRSTSRALQPRGATHF